MQPNTICHGLVSSRRFLNRVQKRLQRSENSSIGYFEDPSFEESATQPVETFRRTPPHPLPFSGEDGKKGHLRSLNLAEIRNKSFIQKSFLK